MIPIILTDFYKVEHFRMYPEGTMLIYSNLTPRKSRMPGVNSIVVFGIQRFIKKFLIEKFDKEFFGVPWSYVENEYKYAINTDTEHIKKLHDLGFLPLEIQALPEGTRCPIRVPCMVMWNTHPDFYWLTNYLETLLSCELWQAMTSATIAAEYRKILSKYALETGGNTDFVQWQAHDFSMRGMSSLESSIISGMGHLTSFTGTDTIPAIYALRNFYKGEGLIGASVPATEHSVMCMGLKDDELGTFSRLLDLYPTGILSVVSDTWDLWKVCTEYLPALKDKVLARDGKLVIRPDSGDPVDIICGTNYQVISSREDFTGENGDIIEFEGNLYQAELEHDGNFFFNEVHKVNNEYTKKGVIELLWDVFGGKVNNLGYKELDPHIGAIYGDSITLERAKQICERLKAKGFASTNIVFGVGSFTYQYNTRDTFGFAMKATYGEVKTYKVMNNISSGPTPIGPLGAWFKEPREIWKDPITDDGTKKSAKGLLAVVKDANNQLVLEDQITWEMVHDDSNELKTVFRNGKLLIEHSLDEIRERIALNL